MRRRFFPSALVDGPVDGPWTDFVVTNGTAEPGFTPRWRKNSRGIVESVGKVNVTDADTLTLQFPLGSRPVGTAPGSYNYNYIGAGSTNACYVIISNGGVYFATPGVLADISHIVFATALS